LRKRRKKIRKDFKKCIIRMNWKLRNSYNIRKGSQTHKQCFDYHTTNSFRKNNLEKQLKSNITQSMQITLNKILASTTKLKEKKSFLSKLRA